MPFLQRKQSTPHYKLRSEIEQLLRTAGIHTGMWARSGNLQESKRATPTEDGGFEWVLTTEKPTLVWDWKRWEFVYEVLLADGMLVPANGQVVLLDSHSRYSVKDVLGHVRDFSETDAGEYAARSGIVYFAEDADSQAAKQKVEGRHITDGSVGYKQIKSIWIPEGDEASVRGRTFEGPLRVTYEWSLMEFSITPIGADVLAKVRDLHSLCGA
ncbi:hypothetical protein [Desulforhopalus singaporensis]|uniref:Uncharacterized protein n=1 Tax=Desulforhopalus singaporensis TaxID=91360 RepID=A0A1H0UTU0_9BACT|nr:hypothetical protein [Desulforhopalus singaporensis]SDP69637.1 hypothetical protein SAMN05660330_03713 [Desulforhopalus singaporensis]